MCIRDSVEAGYFRPVISARLFQTVISGRSISCRMAADRIGALSIRATDVFVSLISQKYGKINTKEYLAKKQDMGYNEDEVQKLSLIHI